MRFFGFPLRPEEAALPLPKRRRQEGRNWIALTTDYGLHPFAGPPAVACAVAASPTDCLPMRATNCGRPSTMLLHIWAGILIGLPTKDHRTRGGSVGTPLAGQEIAWQHERQEELTVKYKVVLKESEEGFSVSCPGLPGCWSQGGTEEEALANIREAIREYLEARDAMMKDQETREVEVLV